LDEVEAADVMEALRELMEVYPASAESRGGRVARGLSVVEHLA
jgi:hypothetical protein